MSEVRNPTVTPARVWTMALALALTGAANVADAALARVAVTSFSFAATGDLDPTGNPYFLFFPDDPGARPQVGKVEAHTNNNAINAGPNALVPSDWTAPGGATRPRLKPMRPSRRPLTLRAILDIRCRFSRWVRARRHSPMDSRRERLATSNNPASSASATASAVSRVLTVAMARVR
jgi:hypothetical protein